MHREELQESTEIWSSFKFLRNQELPEVYKHKRNIRFLFFSEDNVDGHGKQIRQEENGDSLLQDKSN